jgi:malonyl-CoA decarboxylase
VPGFARWLKSAEEGENTLELSRLRDHLSSADWHRNAEIIGEASPLLQRAAAHYFLTARAAGGRLIDPVARFHLGNGARLERLNFPGDVSARGLRESHGLMVNYLYKLDDIERNHEAYAERGEVVASPEVRKWLAAGSTGKTSSRTQEKLNA